METYVFVSFSLNMAVVVTECLLLAMGIYPRVVKISMANVIGRLIAALGFAGWTAFLLWG